MDAFQTVKICTEEKMNLEFVLMSKNDVVCSVKIEQGVVVKHEALCDIRAKFFHWKYTVSQEGILDWLKTRVIPPTRTKEYIAEILQQYDLPFYSVEGLLKKTRGVSTDDFFWLRFPNDKGVTWNDVKIRRD